MRLTINGVTYPSFDEFDYVWFRRINLDPHVLDFADDDQLPYRKSWQSFFKGLIWQIRLNLHARAHVVHDPLDFELQNSKSIHLQFARDCGFATLETRFSNSKTCIQEINSHSLICKAFGPYSAVTEEGLLRSLTSQFDADVFDDEIIRFHPAIYQGRIYSDREVRVTRFGKHLSSLTIENVYTGTQNPDWRAGDGIKTIFSLGVDESVAQNIDRFMNVMKLEFACFDFLIDADGGWKFLECNPAGQFLFVEEAYPEARMLEDFVSFLVGQDVEGSTRPALRPREIEASDVFRKLTRDPLTVIRPGDVVWIVCGS